MPTLITFILLVCKRDAQGNWVTPGNGPSHHFKYHLQLKVKEDLGELGGEEASYGQSPGKQGLSCFAELSCYTDLSLCLSFDRGF